jgi:glycosyltransferase involved in cell wall biosynthesis
MTTFYAIPTKLIKGIPLLSNLISDAMGSHKITMSSMFFRADILFSNVILSNSRAGLAAYRLNTPKARVIWNGVHLERFNVTHNVDEVRKEFEIKTTFMLVMVAAFSSMKDYDLFLDIAKRISKGKI